MYNSPQANTGGAIMFSAGMVAAAQAAQAAISLYRLEVDGERAFMESIKDLPSDQRSAAIQRRIEVKAQIRKEMNEERRHQEMCAAIRSAGQSSSLRPIDLFLLMR